MMIKVCYLQMSFCIQHIIQTKLYKNYVQWKIRVWNIISQKIDTSHYFHHIMEKLSSKTIVDSNLCVLHNNKDNCFTRLKTLLFKHIKFRNSLYCSRMVVLSLSTLMLDLHRLQMQCFLLWFTKMHNWLPQIKVYFSYFWF
jgi:hypothetical protein